MRADWKGDCSHSIGKWRLRPIWFLYPLLSVYIAFVYLGLSGMAHGLIGRIHLFGCIVVFLDLITVMGIHMYYSFDYYWSIGLTETKLDDSFPKAQFCVEDFATYKIDRTTRGGGGGLLYYIRSNIPHRLRPDINECDSNGVESIILQVKKKSEKCFFILIYKPPNVQANALNNVMTHILDKCLVECKSVYLLGDLNVDFNLSSYVLSDVLDAYNLRNVVKGPTCFKSKTNPTLIDVILTNTPERLASHLNVSIGVSDFHNIVCASTKMHAPSTVPLPCCKLTNV